MENVQTVNDKKVMASVQKKEERIHNFQEVSLGYTKEEAYKEASRCLQCKNPRCVIGCPVGIEIPKFIEAIKEEKMEMAYNIITEASTLPAVCGRVCPQENQCEKMCIKGFKSDAIAIGALERYVADYANMHHLKKNKESEKKEQRIAIIGSGPSGLSCAGTLAKEGYRVTVYEVLHKAGGVLTYGIPEFRLPKQIVEKEVVDLKHMGVEFVLDTLIGKTITLSNLKEDYDAIYIATGAGLPKFMGIPNELACGVFSANEVLTRINLMKAYEDGNTPLYLGDKIIVVGGGNVACDVARSLKRFGKDVSIVYRRGISDMPARKEEVHHLLEEQIEIKEFLNPVRICVDSNQLVTGIEVVHMVSVGTDDKGRAIVEEVRDSKEVLECDMVVMALGTNINALAIENTDIKVRENGCIEVDGTRTSSDRCFAGGDVVTGAATVILAMEAGKKAAYEIIDLFEKEKTSVV